MAQGALISLDNTLQREGGSGIQNIKISGLLTVVGDVLTGTDARPLPAGCLMPTGTAAIGTANSFSGWDLADGGTAGVQWAQSYPTTWIQGSVSYGYVAPAPSGGNIRWEATVKRVNVIAGGTNNVVTIANQVDALVTQAAGTANVMNHVFNNPLNFDFHNVDAIFGEVTSINVQRLGADGADTDTGTVRLTNVNTVRNVLL